MTEDTQANAVVVAPGEGESYWQPLPANGYTDVRITNRSAAGTDRFSTGVQVIAPGSHVREHFHEDLDELLFFWEGRGRAVIDGIEHTLVPGTTVYVAPGCRHSFINDGEGDLKMMWVAMPGGIESYFAGIGRPRAPGEPAPAPFPRPADVEAIQAGAGFGKLASEP